MNSEIKKATAYQLYIRGKMTQKDIAAEVGCTPKTLKKWIDDGGWNNKKEDHSITRKQLLSDSYDQLRALNDKIKREMNGVPDKAMADAKAIIRKEIEALSSSPLHQYIEVTDELIDYIARYSIKDLQTITKISLDFIEDKARNEK